MKQPVITLIELPATSFGKLNGHLVQDVYSDARMPARAIPSLHANLLKAGFNDVRSIDPMNNKPRGEFLLEDYKRARDSDWIFFSALSRTIDPTKELARLLREDHLFNGRICIGGHHATFTPRETLEWADVVAMYEGDKTVVELVKNGDPEGIKGTAYKKKGEVVIEEKRPYLTSEELDNLPFPYLEDSKGLIRAIPLNTARGCPYDCNFCGVKTFYDRRYTRRSNESILEEVARYQDWPGRFIFFTDDNFAGKIANTKELLHEMIRRGYTKKKLIVQTRVSAGFDDEYLDLLKRANGNMACLGVESRNPDTLEAINKGQTVEQIDEGVRNYRDAGIWVHAMMMFGGDYDKVEDMHNSTKWARKNVDSFQAFALSPIIGTDFRREMVDQGRLITPNHNYLHDGQHVLLRPKNMTPYELQRGIFKMFRDFYSPATVFQPGNFRDPIQLYWKGIMTAYARKTIHKIRYDPQTVDHINRLESLDQ